MRIKNKEIVGLKRKLKLKKIKGLALDIDDTLSSTLGFLIDKLLKKLDNPENLTVEEIAKKYRHTDNIPYWQDEKASKIINDFNISNDSFRELSVIDGASKTVLEVNKLIPIAAYITVRSKKSLIQTKTWLKKHGFPEAPVIARPKNIDRMSGNKWKAKVLEYLYPEIRGIVDDNSGLAKFFGKKYKGTVFLYNHTEAERKDINVIPCKDWETVAKKVKECKL